MRFGALKDAGDVAEIYRLSWNYAYSGIIPHKALNIMLSRRGDDWWRRVIDRSGAVMVAELGGKAVGYATFGRNRAKELPQQGEIYELYLLPEYHGFGLGRQLFNAACHALKRHGMEDAVVWALEDNDGAMRFYENLGGKDIAEGFETFETKKLKKIAFAFDTL